MDDCPLTPEEARALVAQLGLGPFRYGPPTPEFENEKRIFESAKAKLEQIAGQ